MHRSAKTTFVVACLTVFTHAPALLAEEVSIAGSTAMADSLILPNKGAIEMQAGQELSVQAVRSLRGFHSLVRGDVDIAMISAPLSEMIAQLEAAAPEALDNQALVALPIRGFQVAFVVHPSNPLRSLSATAMKKVLTGEVTNWKALGGPDQPIETVMQSSGSGVRWRRRAPLGLGERCAGDDP